MFEFSAPAAPATSDRKSAIAGRPARRTGLSALQLDGRLAGIALRVPVPNGSITDLVATLATEATRDDINAAFAEAAVAGSYRGVLRAAFVV